MNTFIKSVASLILGLFLVTTIQAQNNISLQIHHHLNAYDFSLTQQSITPDSVLFTVDRLEYYLSEFRITHDGGQQTSIPDFWALVNAEKATLLDLGLHNIDSVEAISFGVGVNEDVNHNDPSTYPSLHPLAHQVPSMHWGWTSGYRFVAMEGSSNGQSYGIHALGDRNYFTTTISVDEVAQNGNITIELFADYSQALAGIAVDQGIIEHGETGSAVVILENFNEHVFGLTAPTDSLPSNMGDSANGVREIPEDIGMHVYPNPTTNRMVNIRFEKNTLTQLELFDITGKLVLSENMLNETLQLTNLNAGVYIVKATNDLGDVFLDRLIVR